MTPQEVMDCWHAVFPNSMVSTTTSFGAHGFRFMLAKDLTECSNRIAENDPLMYGGIIRDGNWSEAYSHMYVKPTEPNRVYSSVKLRAKSIKNVDAKKLTKRFQDVRKFVMDNAHNLKNPLFDISTK
jgi:hypothetical protein